MPIFNTEGSMICKRLGSLAVLLVLLAFPVSASMVSFLLVETGLRENAPNNQFSGLWEGGLMAAFFDAGHIVTNSPIVRMETRPPNDISGAVEKDFSEAIAGGADFYVLGFMEYQAMGNRLVPVSIALKLYNTASRSLVFEQNFPAGSGRSNDDEFRLAQNAGRVIISHLEGR